MNTATCYIQVTESLHAGEAAAKDIVDKLGGVTPDFIFLFVSVGHEIPEVIQGILTVLPDTPVCGCSGAGIITNEGCDEASHSVCLVAISAKNVKFEPFIFSGLKEGAENVGRDVAEIVQAGLNQESKNRLLFLFPDGVTVNVDALYRGLRGGVSGHIDIVGGTAGNDFGSNATYQFYNNTVVTDSVVGVLMTGDFRHRIGVTHGSRPVGLFRKITRVDKNVILEIDNIPALELLKEFIGENRVKDIGQVLNLFELGEKFEGMGYEGDIINRAILGTDHERQGIRLAVEIPEGSEVQITRRDMKLVLQHTAIKAQEIIDEMEVPDKALYLYFNCSGRGAYLFGETDPDVNALRKELGSDWNMAGFFSFGELAPIKGRNFFHNYTGVIVGLE